MDSRTDAEQPGFSPDSSQPEGANHLRRQRLQMSDKGDLSNPVVMAAVATAPAGQAVRAFKERRRSPRFRCSGSAEFRAEGSDVRMWGTVKDVSLHGCYVEMNTTFPIDTKVHLVLEAMGVRVEVQGSVRVSYPFLGMGICFSEIEPGQQLQLEQLLSVLSGQNGIAVPELAQGSTSRHAFVAVDAKAFLEGIRQFFESNRLLSREDCYEIAKRARQH